MKKVKDIPKSDRPRERLLHKGPAALSDVELMAVLLGSGIEGHDVMTVASRILKVLDEEGDRMELGRLSQVEGVGPAKAALIAAALEFARRRIHPEGLKISFPADVLPLIMNYADRKQEHFIAITVNGAKEVIATRVITVGLATQSQVHPREVFADAIADRASGIIIAHNHPSGPLTPSKEDLQITDRLKAAGDLLGIKLLDHIVFNRKGYYSLVEHGELQEHAETP